MRSTAWSLLSLVVLTVLFSVFATSALDTSGGSPGNPGNSDVVMLGLSGVYLGQIGAVVLGVLVMAAEYGTGMIRATFVANPRRWTVLTAKTTVVLGVVLAAGLVATLASFFVGEAILQGNGFVYANGYPAATLGNGPTLCRGPRDHCLLRRAGSARSRHRCDPAQYRGSHDNRTRAVVRADDRAGVPVGGDPEVGADVRTDAGRPRGAGDRRELGQFHVGRSDTDRAVGGLGRRLCVRRGSLARRLLGDQET